MNTLIFLEYIYGMSILQSVIPFICKQKFTRTILPGSIVFLLAACGGDSSSGNDDTQKVDVVPSIYNLGDCTDEKDGDTVFVKDEKADYVCLSGKWINLNFNENEASASSSLCEDASEECDEAISSSSKESSSTSSPSSDSRDDSGNSSTGSSNSNEQNHSSSSVPKDVSSANCTFSDCWNWDVPKDAYLNSKITYGTITDARDKKEYKIVTIGTGEKARTWMAENLNYFDDKNSSLKDNTWCYDDDEKKCEVTGRFYTWAAAIDSAKLYNDNSLDCGYGKTCSLPDTVYGICPPGWHLPSVAEWNTLIEVAGGEETAGKALKSQRGWTLCSGPNEFEIECLDGSGTDDYGFSVFPVGTRTIFEWRTDEGEDKIDIGFGGIGNDVTFWSSSEKNSGKGKYAYYMHLDAKNDEADTNDGEKRFARPIRCIKNSD